MTDEVTPRQLDDGIDAIQATGLRCSLRDQRVGKLFSAARSADDESVKFGVHDEVGKALAFDRYAPRAKHIAKLRSRQVAAACQRFRKQICRAFNDRSVELEPALAVGKACPKAGSGQVDQPPNVLRHHKMPGRAKDVRAQDGALVKQTVDVRVGGATCAQSKRPLRPAVVLGLDSAQPTHRIKR